jgi:hypothetical protein
MSFRHLIGVGLVAVALSGCALSDLTKSSQAAGTQAAAPAATQPAAAATGRPASTKKAANKAISAMGAEVVGHKGEYLLCSSADTYRDLTTTYYVCRERGCVGSESLAKAVTVPKTKTGCLDVCRKLERDTRSLTSGKSYCTN